MYERVELVSDAVVVSFSPVMWSVCGVAFLSLYQCKLVMHGFGDIER